MKHLTLLFAIAASAFCCAVETTVIFESTFDRQELKEWRLPPEIASVRNIGGTPVLQISIPSGKEKGGPHTAQKEIDLTPYRGRQLFLQYESKAEEVSKPPHPWNGIKLMLHCKTPTSEVWRNLRNNFGSYEWKTSTILFSVPSDAEKATIHLGLQESSGTLLVRKVRILLAEPVLQLPENFKATYSERVADTPLLRGTMGPNSYKAEDLEELARWNANLIRWQIKRNWGKADAERDLAEYMKWFHDKLDELDKVMDHCAKLGIKVIIDLHTPPGGRYEDNEMAMFYEPVYLEAFYQMWEEMSHRYKDHPALWAYDLLNEPVQTNLTPTDYLTVQYEAAKKIRAIDPDTPVIVASNNWNTPSSFSELQPLPLNNIIYQAHMYEPGIYTHQRIFNMWGEQGGSEMITYPGVIAGKKWNREQLQLFLKPVRDFQEKYGARIYIGEFSAVRYAPGAALYIEDIIAICEEYGWDWSYHAFRESPFWNVEYADSLEEKRAVEDTDRKRVLLQALAVSD